MKILESNIRENLHDSGLGDDFLRHAPKSTDNKANIEKWDNIKMHPYSQKKK